MNDSSKLDEQSNTSPQGETLRQIGEQILKNNNFNNAFCLAGKAGMKELEEQIKACNVWMKREKLLQAAKLIMDSHDKKITLPANADFHGKVRYYGETNLCEVMGHEVSYATCQEDVGGYTTVGYYFEKLIESYSSALSGEDAYAQACEIVQALNSMPSEDAETAYLELCDTLHIPRETAISSRILRAMGEYIRLRPLYVNESIPKRMTDPVQRKICTLFTQLKSNPDTSLPQFIRVAKEIDHLCAQFLRSLPDEKRLTSETQDYDFELEKTLRRPDILEIATSKK